MTEHAHRGRGVAYLGPSGTYSHAAALEHFREADYSWTACPTIVAVFETVSRGEAQFGVVPVENSSEGGVSFTLDQLLNCDLVASAEILLPIELCLASAEPELRSIREVLSHPQPLAQSRLWLHAHLPSAKAVPWSSTSAAMREVKSRPGAAAIGSSLCAQTEGLMTLATGIQDSTDNTTRFLVLGRETPARTGNDKTSLVFATKHERGALRRALEVFDDEGINLTRIESRPRPGAIWQYVFFTDIEGHRADDNVRRALEKLEAQQEMIRVFGSYPRAV